MSRREPIPPTTAIVDRRPTQITVGCGEVERKRRGWREQTAARDIPGWTYGPRQSPTPDQPSMSQHASL